MWHFHFTYEGERTLCSDNNPPLMWCLTPLCLRKWVSVCVCVCVRSLQGFGTKHVIKLVYVQHQSVHLVYQSASLPWRCCFFLLCSVDKYKRIILSSLHSSAAVAHFRWIFNIHGHSTLYVMFTCCNQGRLLMLVGYLSTYHITVSLFLFLQ